MSTAQYMDFTYLKMKIMLYVKYASKYRRQSKGDNKALIMVMSFVGMGKQLRRKPLETPAFSKDIAVCLLNVR